MVWSDYHRERADEFIKAHQANHDAKVLPRIQELQDQGLSLRAIARRLEEEFPPPRKKWSHVAVLRILMRAAEGFVEVSPADVETCSDCGTRLVSRKQPGSDLMRAFCPAGCELQEIVTP